MDAIVENVAPLSSAISRVWLPQLSLTGCLRGMMTRDTRHANLTPSQNFNYFPATPLCSISWWMHGRGERVLGPFPERAAALDDARAPITSRIALGGPFNLPLASWNAGPMQGVVLMFMPDALQLMTGFDPATHMNRFSDIRESLPPDWCDSVKQFSLTLTTPLECARIEAFLEPRWSVVRPRQPMAGHRYRIGHTASHCARPNLPQAQAFGSSSAESSFGLGSRCANCRA